nr:FHA domain-containing protein [Microbacterium natoriense]
MQVAGVRIVLAETGSAPGLRFRGWRAADTRRGADPLLPHRDVPVLASPEAAERRSATPDLRPRNSVPVSQGQTSSAPQASSVAEAALIADPPGVKPAACVLVVDETLRSSVTSRTRVGRSPAAVDGATVVAIPDLARELSKEHFMLEYDQAGGLTVTDLSSTNGTTLNGVDIAPAIPYGFVFGDLIEAGGHRFRVEARSRVENREVA